MITIDTYQKDGFILKWPYHPDPVVRGSIIGTVKRTGGFYFSKKDGGWVCDGPEGILDLDRLEMWQNITTVTSRAQLAIEAFRKKLDQILVAKHQESKETYGFQQAGSQALVLQHRGLLADDMGLGKSKQALEAARSIDISPRVLVVAPKTLTYNWAAEVEKWCPKWKFGVVPDAPKERNSFYKSMGEMEVVIVNYEKLLLKDWPNWHWDVIIFDEAHKLKNTATATWKAAKKLKGDYIWALTGTPLEIRVEELYGIMSLLRPGIFGNYTRFRDQHLVTDAWGNTIGQKNLDLLKMRIGPWMTRRTKQEVLSQLPPKLYNQVFVEWTSEEAKGYQHIEKEFEEWLDEQDRSYSEANSLTQLLRLQQFTSSPSLLDMIGIGSKYQLLLQTIKEWDGKVLVFTRFEKMAELLVGLLQHSLGLEHLPMIAGPVKAEHRVALVQLFNVDEEQRVMVSTDAGAYGLNITSANLVIHYDQLWNPGKMHQREDRLHRIGQESVVNVLSLIVPGTVDEGMAKILVKRQDLFNNIIEGAEEVTINKLGSGALKKIALGMA